MKLPSWLPGGNAARPRTEDSSAPSSGGSKSFLARALLPSGPRSRNESTQAEKPGQPAPSAPRPRARLTKPSPAEKQMARAERHALRQALVEALTPPRVPGKLTKLSPEAKAGRLADFEARAPGIAARARDLAAGRFATQPKVRFIDLSPRDQSARLDQFRAAERSANAEREMKDASTQTGDRPRHRMEAEASSGAFMMHGALALPQTPLRQAAVARLPKLTMGGLLPIPESASFHETDDSDDDTTSDDMEVDVGTAIAQPMQGLRGPTVVQIGPTARNADGHESSDGNARIRPDPRAGGPGD